MVIAYNSQTRHTQVNYSGYVCVCRGGGWFYTSQFDLQRAPVATQRILFRAHVVLTGVLTGVVYGVRSQITKTSLHRCRPYDQIVSDNIIESEILCTDNKRLITVSGYS